MIEKAYVNRNIEVVKEIRFVSEGDALKQLKSVPSVEIGPLLTKSKKKAFTTTRIVSNCRNPCRSRLTMITLRTRSAYYT